MRSEISGRVRGLTRNKKGRLIQTLISLNTKQINTEACPFCRGQCNGLKSRRASSPCLKSGASALRVFGEHSP